MVRTLNTSAVRAVIRAHMQGMCEGAIAKLMTMDRTVVINIVYSYGIRRQLEIIGI